MKRAISLILVILMALSLAACTQNTPPAADPTEAPEATQAPEATEAPDETEEPEITGAPEETEEPMLTEEPTPVPTAMPERPEEDEDIPKVYAGRDVFFVTKPDGSLWAWGKNDHGQLGLGDTKDRTAPQLVGWGLTPVIVGETVFALSVDGVLWGWGRNDLAQLGTGDTQDRTRPAELMYSVKQVEKHRDAEIFALTEAGELWTWGISEYLDLTSEQRAERLSPALLFENVSRFDSEFMIKDGDLWRRWGEEWKFYASGVRNVWHDYDTVAIEAEDGFLYAIGSRDAIFFEEEPERRLVMESFRSVTVSDGYIWVLTQDGSLYRYKDGYSSILPIDSETGFGELTYVMNEVVEFATETSMGEDWGYDYKLALKADGELWAWGEYTEPALGKLQMSESEVPECVAHGVRSFVTTGAQTYIIAGDGEVWATGWAGEGFVFGGLGDGTDATRYGFVYLGIEGFCTVTSRMDDEIIGYDDGTDGIRLYCRTFAVDAEGRIFAWGWNGDGLLGTGANAETVLTPEEIVFE